jgi:hypothetical protein
VSEQKSMDEAFLQEKVACLDGTMMKKRPRKGFAEADPILHHIQWQYRISW